MQCLQTSGLPELERMLNAVINRQQSLFDQFIELDKPTSYQAGKCQAFFAVICHSILYWIKYTCLMLEDFLVFVVNTIFLKTGA